MQYRVSHIALSLMAIAVLIVIGTACASAETPSGYVVLPAAGGQFSAAYTGMHESLIRVMLIDSTIRPGETVHAKKTIDHFITTLSVDLKWDNPNADLSIVIYSPTCRQFGPWRDDFDGIIDRRINKDIYNSGGIEQGDWEYYITNWGTEETHYSV